MDYITKAWLDFFDRRIEQVANAKPGRRACGCILTKVEALNAIDMEVLCDTHKKAIDDKDWKSFRAMIVSQPIESDTPNLGLDGESTLPGGRHAFLNKKGL